MIGFHAERARSTITSSPSPPEDDPGQFPEPSLSEFTEAFEPDISVAAGRIAVTGFGASVFFLVLVALIVMLEAGGPGAPGFLYGISLVALGLGLVLSIVGLSKRHRISRKDHRLAVAGLVISVASIVALPFLLIVAFAMFMGDFFT